MNIIRRIISLFILASSINNTPSFAAQEQAYDPQHTMLALNMAVVSVHRILSAQDRIILDQEYQNIINNLSIGNIKSDPEITELYDRLIKLIGQKRLREEELKQVRERYDSQMEGRLTNALSDAAKGAKEALKGAHKNPFALAVGIFRLIPACTASYFKYQSSETNIRQELDRSLYELKKEEMKDFDDMQVQLLSSSWNLMYKYHLPDEYRLVQKTMDDFYRAVEEDDEPSRRLRMMRALEDDFKVYPPYWYYRARTAMEANNQSEADRCFDRFDEVWRPVLRRDPYKLEVTKYRINALVNHGDTESEDVRREVLRLLGVMRDNTLREDWANNIFAGAAYYTLGEKEKGIKCIEINIDFGYESDISTAMLQQMRKGVKPSELPSDTLRGMNLNELISGMKNEHKEAALALADFFDGREDSVKALEAMSADKNPLVIHALRLFDFKKADVSEFRKIYDLAMIEASSKDNISVQYSGVLRMVKSYADSESIPANIFLADMYNYGLGVKRDTVQAMKYYEKAGNRKDLYSQFMCIHLTLANRDYLTKRAKTNEEISGESYNRGMKYYIEKNYSEAIGYFIHASQYGHSGAEYMLGVIYENAYGVAKDISTARFWYSEAVSRGNNDAKTALQRLSDGESKSSWWWPF